MLINPDPKIVNTRGCGPLMKYWYRRGFWEIFLWVYLEYLHWSLYDICIST